LLHVFTFEIRACTLRSVFISLPYGISPSGFEEHQRLTAYHEHSILYRRENVQILSPYAQNDVEESARKPQTCVTATSCIC